MKHLIASIFIALAALFSAADASAATRFFKELASLPGVESTYIGPAALRFASSAIYASFSSDLDCDIKELKSIETLECSDTKSFGKIETFISGLVDKLSLETMIESNEEDETTRIYCRSKEGEPDTIEYMLIESIEPDEYSLVFMQGAFTLNYDKTAIVSARRSGN